MTQKKYICYDNLKKLNANISSISSFFSFIVNKNNNKVPFSSEVGYIKKNKNFLKVVGLYLNIKFYFIYFLFISGKMSKQSFYLKIKNINTLFLNTQKNNFKNYNISKSENYKILFEILKFKIFYNNLKNSTSTLGNIYTELNYKFIKYAKDNLNFYFKFFGFFERIKILNTELDGKIKKHKNILKSLKYFGIFNNDCLGEANFDEFSFKNLNNYKSLVNKNLKIRESAYFLKNIKIFPNWWYLYYSESTKSLNVFLNR